MRYLNPNHPTLKTEIKQFQKMSFTERVFGWALKHLWIVLVFSILIKAHYIGLIFKNSKLPTIHKYSNEI